MVASHVQPHRRNPWNLLNLPQWFDRDRQTEYPHPDDGFVRFVSQDDSMAASYLQSYGCGSRNVCHLPQWQYSHWKAINSYSNYCFV